MQNSRRRILLLSPDITRPVFNQNGRLKVDRFLPPLGLGYLAVVLGKKDYQVKVIDCLGWSILALKKEIAAFGPQVVGISCFTEHRGGALRLARLVKKIGPKIPVVFGGSHASFMYHQILVSYPEVDFCVLGEGEQTLVELLEKIFKEKPKAYKEAAGLAFRKGKKIVLTPPRPFTEDLDSLPFPDREWMDPNLYEFPHHQVRGKKVAPIIASRGCPFGCQFCSTSQFWGKKARFRSVGNVMAEIDFLWQKGFRVLNFLDDTFTLDQERIQTICQKMIEKGYKFFWCCSTRVGLVSRKTARLMKKAGCFSVTIGVESLSPKILKNINKKFRLFQAVKTFRNLHEAGIESGCLLMLGNPGEDEGSIKETIDNLKKMAPDGIFTNLTQVYPGTPLYELAKEKGFVNDDYWLDEKRAAPIYLAENSLEKLLQFEKMVWESFFWQKKDLLRWFSRKTGFGSRLWPIVSAIKGEKDGF